MSSSKEESIPDKTPPVTFQRRSSTEPDRQLPEELVKARVSLNSSSPRLHGLIASEADFMQNLEEELPSQSPLLDSPSDDIVNDPGSSPDGKRSQPFPRITSESELEEDIEPLKEETELVNTKKRKNNHKKWKRNVQSQKINTGQSFVSRTGKEKRAKRVQSPCNNKCSFKCQQNIPLHYRLQIFNDYYKLGNKSAQRSFIDKCMVYPSQEKGVNDGKKRKPNVKYYFKVNSRKIRVCKIFFIQTLDISSNTIATVKKKTSIRGILDGEQRGCHLNKKKYPEEIKEGIKNHINSYPRVESHYCRKDSKREYLQGDLNLTLMYKHYKEKCEAEGQLFSKQYYYQKIFNEHFNIAFHVPKKDACAFCEAGNRVNSQEDDLIRHKGEVKLSCEDKERAKQSSNKQSRVCAFDLQAVMPLPDGDHRL